MVSMNSVTTRAIDHARDSAEGIFSERVVRNGPLQQTVVALREGARLAEHDSDVPASLYIMAGAVRVEASEPFVLQSGDLHEMPSRRRGVTAVMDTVMLMSAVTSIPSEDSSGSDLHDHVLPPA
jgi:quercetin dioxygenase-like cupin family protein